MKHRYLAMKLESKLACLILILAGSGTENNSICGVPDLTPERVGLSDTQPRQLLALTFV